MKFRHLYLSLSLSLVFCSNPVREDQVLEVDDVPPNTIPGTSVSRPYDVSKLLFYSEAVSGDKVRLALVSQEDVVDSAHYRIRTLTYRGDSLVDQDTVVGSWDPWGRNFFMKAKFELSLDDQGFGHFVVNADSGGCRYLTERPDGIWKERYLLDRRNAKPESDRYSANYDFGRRSDISVYNGRVDIVTTGDYRSGGWPFSIMYRIFGELDGDSLSNEYVSADTAIYAEEIFDLVISNKHDRLTILYAIGQYGGWNGDRLLVSRDHPGISGYRYWNLVSAWNLSTMPILIVSESDSSLTVRTPSGGFTASFGQ